MLQKLNKKVALVIVQKCLDFQLKQKLQSKFIRSVENPDLYFQDILNNILILQQKTQKLEDVDYLINQLLNCMCKNNLNCYQKYQQYSMEVIAYLNQLSLEQFLTDEIMQKLESQLYIYSKFSKKRTNIRLQNQNTLKFRQEYMKILNQIWMKISELNYQKLQQQNFSTLKFSNVLDRLFLSFLSLTKQKKTEEENQYIQNFMQKSFQTLRFLQSEQFQFQQDFVDSCRILTIELQDFLTTDPLCIVNCYEDYLSFNVQACFVFQFKNDYIHKLFLCVILKILKNSFYTKIQKPSTLSKFYHKKKIDFCAETSQNLFAEESKKNQFFIKIFDFFMNDLEEEKQDYYLDDERIETIFKNCETDLSKFQLGRNIFMSLLLLYPSTYLPLYCQSLREIFNNFQESKIQVIDGIFSVFLTLNKLPKEVFQNTENQIDQKQILFYLQNLAVKYQILLKRFLSIITNKQIATFYTQDQLSQIMTLFLPKLSLGYLILLSQKYGALAEEKLFDFLLLFEIIFEKLLFAVTSNVKRFSSSSYQQCRKLIFSQKTENQSKILAIIEKFDLQSFFQLCQNSNQDSLYRLLELFITIVQYFTQNQHILIFQIIDKLLEIFLKKSSAKDQIVKLDDIYYQIFLYLPFILQFDQQETIFVLLTQKYIKNFDQIKISQDANILFDNINILEQIIVIKVDSDINFIIELADYFYQKINQEKDLDQGIVNKYKTEYFSFYLSLSIQIKIQDVQIQVNFDNFVNNLLNEFYNNNEISSQYILSLKEEIINMFHFILTQNSKLIINSIQQHNREIFFQKLEQYLQFINQPYSKRLAAIGLIELLKNFEIQEQNMQNFLIQKVQEYCNKNEKEKRRNSSRVKQPQEQETIYFLKEQIRKDYYLEIDLEDYLHQQLPFIHQFQNHQIIYQQLKKLIIKITKNKEEPTQKKHFKNFGELL